ASVAASVDGDDDGDGDGRGEGHDVIVGSPDYVIKTESGWLPQRCDDGGLVTASTSSAANIGIFVGGDNGGDDGGLVGDLGAPYLRASRHHQQPLQLPQPQHQLTPTSASTSNLPPQLHNPLPKTTSSLPLAPQSEPALQQRLSDCTVRASGTSGCSQAWLPTTSPVPPHAAVLPPSWGSPGTLCEASAPLPLLHALAMFATPQPPSTAAVGGGADALPPLPPPPHTSTLQRLKEAAAAVAAYKKRQAPRRMSSANTNLASLPFGSGPLGTRTLTAAQYSVPPLSAAAALSCGNGMGGGNGGPASVNPIATEPTQREGPNLPIAIGCTTHAVPKKTSRAYGVNGLAGSCGRRLSMRPHLGTITDGVEVQSGSNHGFGARSSAEAGCNSQCGGEDVGAEAHDMANLRGAATGAECGDGICNLPGGSDAGPQSLELTADNTPVRGALGRCWRVTSESGKGGDGGGGGGRVDDHRRVTVGAVGHLDKPPGRATRNVGSATRRRRQTPHTNAQSRVRQLLTNFSSLREEEQQLPRHSCLHTLATPPPQSQQPQQQQAHRHYHVYRAIGCGDVGSGTVSGCVGLRRVQLGATDNGGDAAAAGSDGNYSPEIAHRRKEFSTGNNVATAVGAARSGCSSSAPLNARYLPAAAADTMARGPVSEAEWNADFRTLSSESDGGSAGNAADP
ncbi:hypothetical protein Vafri_19740, partial [Volvox africanus]